jgi:branched-chain amino acid transport system substrate-binding protein
MYSQISDIKIGVLLPKSSLYPAIGFDIRDGLKERLSLDTSCNYKLIYENIGYGGDSAVVYEKVEKLLMQEEVMVVVAFLDHTAALKLNPLFEQTKRLLIVLDPGAHSPLSWEDASPFRYSISLQGALNNHLTGILAARNGAEKVFFSTSFYEGGYLQCHTYLKGFESGGNHVLYHSIVPFKINEFNTQQLRDAAVHFQPDTVLALFSAESGAFFLEKYKESGLFENTQFYLSSFMLEESWINTIPYSFGGMTGNVSWCSKIDTPENTFFKNTIQDNCDKDANVFSLLGWEAALLIEQLMQDYVSAGNNMTKALKAFHPISIDSPRGTLELHEPSHIFFGPAYLVAIIEQEATGNCALEIKETIDYNKEHFIKEIPEGVFSKWTNTYLCI